MSRQWNTLYLYAVAMLVAIWLIPAPTLAADALPAEDAIGEVVHMMGTVHAEHPNLGERKLELASPVFQKDAIVTGLKGNVEIRFKDDTIFAQGAKSRIELDDYVFSEDASASNLLFRMGEGTFRFVTGQIVKQNPEAFTLKTPMTTIGIRGTEPFAVVSQEEEQIGVLNIDPTHTVEVTSPKSKVSINKPGLMTSLEKGKTLSPPTPTPTALKNKVMQAAPMTTQGELGAYGTRKDLKQKAEGFKGLLDFEKGNIKGLNTPPDYRHLRTISLQERGRQNAENERDGKTDPSNSIGGGEKSSDDGHGHDDGGGAGGGETGGP